MQIRRYTSKDYPKILQLVKAVYNESILQKTQARFPWQYENNPSNIAQDPNILVVDHEDEIVGMVGHFSQRLKIEDTIVHAYWMGDFMVHPNFRQKQCGLSLARELRKEFYLMMGFPSQEVFKLWSKAGAVKFGEIFEYTCNPKRFSLVQTIISAFHSRKYEMKILHEFGEKFDQFWNEISKHYKVIQVRDRTFLTWRFLKCPHLSYITLAAINNDKILGYSILRFEKSIDGANKGYIVDLLSQRDPVLMNALVSESMRLLAKKGCTLVTMRSSSSDEMISKVLLSLNFKITERRAGILYNKVFKEKEHILSQPDNWFLSLADSDMDYS